jgi:hypothetical protein
MSLLGVKQRLMVVQPAVESWVLNITGGHSKWKTSLHAVEFLGDRHLLRWPLNSVPLSNSRPHCRDNKSLPLDLSWAGWSHSTFSYYMLLILCCMPGSQMWISDQNLNTSPICVICNTFPIMPLAVHHNVNTGLALQGQTPLCFFWLSSQGISP